MKNKKLRGAISSVSYTLLCIYCFPTGIIYWLMNDKSFIESLFDEDFNVFSLRLIFTIPMSAIYIVLLSSIFGGL